MMVLGCVASLYGTHIINALRVEAFQARHPEARRLGCDDRFLRLWEFYLAYCEAGFAEHCTGVVQMLLARPARGHASAWRDVATHVARRPASA